jgi:hypothetical protein
MGNNKIVTFLVVDDEKPANSISKVTLLIIIIVIIFLIVFLPRQKIEGMSKKIEKTIEARKEEKEQVPPLKFNPHKDEDLAKTILYPSDSMAFDSLLFPEIPTKPLILSYDTNSNLNFDKLKNNLDYIQQARDMQYDRSDFSKFGSAYAPMSMLYSEQTRYI